MYSVRDIYKTGVGPSSSHTMGPAYLAKEFITRYPTADRVTATLYGSLAMTGKGHGTDRAITEMLAPVETAIVFNTEKTDLQHPNTVDFVAFQNGNEIGRMTALSIGGGDVRIVGESIHRKDGVCRILLYRNRGDLQIARHPPVRLCV